MSTAPIWSKVVARIKIYILAGCELQNDTEKCYSASELYNSNFFNLSKRYMKVLNNDNWLILSDYHGLIWQGAMIAPYSSNSMNRKERISRLENNLRKENIEKLLISVGVLSHDIINEELRKGKSSMSNVTFILIGDTPSLRQASELLSNVGAKIRMPMRNLNAIKQSLWLLNTAKTEAELNIINGGESSS